MRTINGMTNFSKREIHLAYSIVCNRSNSGRRPLQVDRRTRIGNLALHLNSNVDKSLIKEKQYNRRFNHYYYRNVLDSSIYFDYKDNRKDIKFITSERISFINGRNHWAKSERDSKILRILAKHF